MLNNLGMQKKTKLYENCIKLNWHIFKLYIYRSPWLRERVYGILFLIKFQDFIIYVSWNTIMKLTLFLFNFIFLKKTCQKTNRNFHSTYWDFFGIGRTLFVSFFVVVLFVLNIYNSNINHKCPSTLLTTLVHIFM